MSRFSWLSHDILALAGPSLEERQELFDFIVEELRIREALCPHRMRPVRTALENQRMTCSLWFLMGIWLTSPSASRLSRARACCLLQQEKPSSTAYWTR